MDYVDILWPDAPFDLLNSIVLAGKRGSEAHGTYIPSDDPESIDDRDVMAIVIPPVQYYYGLSKWEGVDSIKGCWDVVVYEYRKFVGLLLKQNPNVLGMLWLEPEDYIQISPAGQALIDNRDLFRSRKLAADSFAGYAMSQLKKMQGSEFKGYMGARRKALVEKYGYDTKNAAHLVRLLHMGIEYLKCGKLFVRRTADRQLLIDIKKGKWSLDKVQKYADSKLQEFRRAEVDSCLPEQIDLEAVESLVTDSVKRRLNENR